MKKFLIPVLLLTLCWGCKKEDAPAPANNPGADTTKVPVVVDVNNLKLTITKVNTPVAPHNPGNYSIWFEMHKGAIYVGNPSNTAVAQYFDKYDIATNTFSSLPVDDNVCACGYSSKLVSDKNSSIYYIGNDATKYTPGDNTWSALNFPPTVKDNIGEAGAIYFDNKIYYIGGRTPTKLVKYFDLSGQSWYNAPDFPYSTNMCDGVGIGNKLYVFGGGGNKKGFSVYDKNTNSWTSKPDLPFETNFSYANHYVASVGRYIFIQQSDNINVYDSEADKWAATPIINTTNISYGNLFSWDGKLYIAGKNSANDFQLYQATIN